MNRCLLSYTEDDTLQGDICIRIERQRFLYEKLSSLVVKVGVHENNVISG